jgi:hypothetical protein
MNNNSNNEKDSRRNYAGATKTAKTVFTQSAMNRTNYGREKLGTEL